MKRHLFAVSLAVAAASVGCSQMGKDHEREDEDEIEMTLDQVPAAVREGLQREAGGAAIAEVEKEDENGKVVYEADVTIDGKNWEIVVDESGKLVSRKLDDDDEKGEKRDADD